MNKQSALPDGGLYAFIAGALFVFGCLATVLGVVSGLAKDDGTVLLAGFLVGVGMLGFAVVFRAIRDALVLLHAIATSEPSGSPSPAPPTPH